MLLEVSVKISGKELLKPQKPEALPEAHGLPGIRVSFNTFCNFKGKGAKFGCFVTKDVMSRGSSSFFFFFSGIQISKFP